MNGHAENAAGDVLSNASTPSGKNSVEKIYQKKTQLEHILLRPDTYIGSVEPTTQPMWVYDGDDIGMRYRPITFTPGLFKIFDEILVNAADNKQRDSNMKKMKITIDPEKNIYSVWNDGKGIPVQMHKTEKMYVPSLIFGHLLTSSNFDDTQRKVTGGRNGFGAKLCNVFSKKFTVETASRENKRRFKQTWLANMGKACEPTIVDYPHDTDYTQVTFEPDLEKFKMERMDADTVALFTKRAYDMCATVPGISVYLNGKKIPVNNFKDYVELFTKKVNEDDPLAVAPPLVYEKVNARWEVAVCNSEKGFQQISFVNSINTIKGGTHVNSVCDQLVEKLIAQVNRKNKDKKQLVKNFQVKNHLWVFVNCLIENPTFDSQTKETLTLNKSKFGSKCELSDKFLKDVTNKCGIVDNVLQWLNFKAQKDLSKTGAGAKKQVKLKGVPKLDDANDAGGKLSNECTLILTEGDSAKSLAVSGLGVVGRDKYGVFPLRGKLLNVRDSSTKQIIDNAEINNIMKIVGLQTKKKYNDLDEINSLRYGKIMIMTDQDQDGSHIKGLLINMFHHFWPSLLRRNMLDQFITPIVKVTRGKEVHSFYSLPEFDEWRNSTPNWKQFSVKYYKGLGTSTMKEAKEYFSDMERHRIHFKYDGRPCDDSIELGFSKSKIAERKDWLLNYMADRKRRREANEAELYLYKKDTKTVSFSDFIHKELVLFSNADTERSIPNIMDGLKPGQRKVIFTCLKRNDRKEVKVAQLAGSVAEKSAYHHGEASLMATIINLAQNFVGSNNLNLLLPIGQFGTRLQGGKDAASPRYIFTMLNPVTKLLFNPSDDSLLQPQFEDNQKIEPEFYCPVLPIVLLNGAEGIGTGWSTKIHNHDVRDVIANIKRLLNAQEPLPMMPAYKNFQGTIREYDEQMYTIFGNVAVLDEASVEITELPVGVWTQNYKEQVLEPMLLGNEKVKPVITDYNEYHTDTTVKFVVYMTPQTLAEAESSPGGLHKFFKLSCDRANSNMVLFDSQNCIKKYENTIDILKEFYVVRLELYDKRKKFLIGMLTAEGERLSAIARFILEKIAGTIVVENKAKKALIKELQSKQYPSDPVKAWKEEQAKQLKMLKGDLDSEEEEEGADNDQDHVTGEGDVSSRGGAGASSGGDVGGPDYNYILGMPLWSLTKERKDELLRQKDEKLSELNKLQKTTVKQLWLKDLDDVLKEVENQERLENEESMAGIALSNKAAQKKKGSKARAAAQQGAHVDCKPSQNARMVEPPSCEDLKGEKRGKGGAGGAAKRGPKGTAIKTEPGTADDVKAALSSDEEFAGKSLKERLNESGHGGEALELASPTVKKEPEEKVSSGAAKKASGSGAVKKTTTGSTVGAKRGAATLASASSGGKKQMKLTDMPPPTKKPPPQTKKEPGAKGGSGSPSKKKQKKKREEWETDSEEEPDSEDISDLPSGDEEEENGGHQSGSDDSAPPPPKKTARSQPKERKPAPKIDDNDDDDDDDFNFDDDDDDVKPPAPSKKATKSAAKAATVTSSADKASSSAAPSKKTKPVAPKKKKVIADSDESSADDFGGADDESDVVMDASPVVVSSRNAGGRGRKQVNYKAMMSDDDDDDDVD